MKKAILITALLLPLAATPCLAKKRGNDTFRDISDALCVLTPGAAIVSSLFLEEPVQTGAYVLELAAQELFVEGAKELFSDTSLGERPSDEPGDTHDGFISSHVSATTSGAIKLWELYPDNIWVKTASAAAVVAVGAQRVEGDHHTVFQVGLGVGTAFLFDYLGEKVSDYFNVGKQESDQMKIAMALPENGNGLVTSVTWRF